MWVRVETHPHRATVWDLRQYGKEEVSWGPAPISLCFLVVDAMWPAAPCAPCRAFSAMINCTFKLGVKINPGGFGPKSDHSGKKSSRGRGLGEEAFFPGQAAFFRLFWRGLVVLLEGPSGWSTKGVSPTAPLLDDLCLLFVISFFVSSIFFLFLLFSWPLLSPPSPCSLPKLNWPWIPMTYNPREENTEVEVTSI